MRKGMAVGWMVCLLSMVVIGLGYPPLFCQEKGEEKKTDQKPPTERGAPANYDGVYVTEAATGDKIPHPLSKTTKKVTFKGKKVEFPEGMVFVPEGEFIMGEGQSEHKVWLDSYCIGRYEVTNAEWKAFVDATKFRPMPTHWKGGDFPEGKDNHPVVNVSREEAQKYCEWVSNETGWQVRLPTEAEWEKAASWNPKKNIKTVYPWGNSWDPKLCNNGWLLAKFGFRPKDEGADWEKKFKEWEKSEKAREIISLGGNTMPAGSFKRVHTFYGCYDTPGNVYEWCQDWFVNEYYLLKDAKKNPQGPRDEEAEEVEINRVKFKGYVTRGACWYNSSKSLRATFRGIAPPSYRWVSSGFRVVRVMSSE